MERLQYLFSVAFIIIFSGCATIMSGTDETLTFNSEPDGATVLVAGRAGTMKKNTGCLHTFS